MRSNEARVQFYLKRFGVGESIEVRSYFFIESYVVLRSIKVKSQFQRGNINLALKLFLLIETSSLAVYPIRTKGPQYLKV